MATFRFNRSGFPRLVFSFLARLLPFRHNMRAIAALGRLEGALGDTGVAVFEIDLRQRTIFASGTLRALLGQPPMAREQNRVIDLDEWNADVSAEEVENWRLAIQRHDLLDTDRSEMTHSVIGADGSISWLLTKTRFERDGAGRITRLRGAVMDITERKHTDLQLEHARAELKQQVMDWQNLHALSTQLLRPVPAPEHARAILETVTAFHEAEMGLISIFDQVTGELTVTASMGISPAALHQMTQGRLAGNAGASGLAFVERRQIVIEDTETDPRYVRSRAWSRQLGYRAIYCTPFFRASGEILGVVTVHFPTPRRPDERELKLAEFYAASVALFHERLHSETLLHQERDRNRSMLGKLRDVDRRKDEFVAMLAHELRNPLAPISMAAQILNLPGLGEKKLRDTSDIISRQASHMSRLVDDLLDVSRVTRGLVKLACEPVDMRLAAGAALEQSRALLRARGHRLDLRLGDEPAWIAGDRTRMTQVIVNLLNNAAKYTPAGGDIVLQIELLAGRIELSVRDNGIGIGEELMPVLFDLFSQAIRPADRSQGGLGLGLALVKNLVELQGGSVRAASGGENKGSCFTLSLPRLPEPVSGERRQVERIASGDAGARPLQLMVVDDNVDAANTLAEILEAAGHHVRLYHDARSALAAAQLDVPHCLVLDIGLPDMDGYELARRLRAAVPTSGAMLIALTAYGQAQDHQRSRDAGFDHHLIKPADTTRLHALLALVKI
jgi:signal transduction histidine kinase/BarA-like signal transduction histidine kinase